MRRLTSLDEITYRAPAHLAIARHIGGERVRREWRLCGIAEYTAAGYDGIGPTMVDRERRPPTLYSQTSRAGVLADETRRDTAILNDGSGPIALDRERGALLATLLASAVAEQADQMVDGLRLRYAPLVARTARSLGHPDAVLVEATGAFSGSLIDASQFGVSARPSTMKLSSDQAAYIAHDLAWMCEPTRWDATWGFYDALRRLGQQERMVDTLARRRLRSDITSAPVRRSNGLLQTLVTPRRLVA